MKRKNNPRIRIRNLVPARLVHPSVLEAAHQRATSYERTSGNWMLAIGVLYFAALLAQFLAGWSKDADVSRLTLVFFVGFGVVLFLFVVVGLVVRRGEIAPRMAHWRRAMVEEGALVRLVYRDGSVMALTDDGYFFSPKTRFWPLYVRPEPSPSHRVRFTWKQKRGGFWELGVGVTYVKGEGDFRQEIRALKTPMWFEVPNLRLAEVFRATVELKRHFPRGVTIRWTDGYDAALAAVRARGFDPARIWSELEPTPYELVDRRFKELGIRRWKEPPQEHR